MQRDYRLKLYRCDIYRTDRCYAGRQRPTLTSRGYRDGRQDSVPGRIEPRRRQRIRDPQDLRGRPLPLFYRCRVRLDLPVAEPAARRRAGRAHRAHTGKAPRQEGLFDHHQGPPDAGRLAGPAAGRRQVPLRFPVFAVFCPSAAARTGRRDGRAADRVVPRAARPPEILRPHQLGAGAGIRQRFRPGGVWRGTGVSRKQSGPVAGIGRPGARQSRGRKRRRPYRS